MAKHTKVEEYKSEREMRHGIEHMARGGWRVTSQSSYRPRKGIIRTVLGGMIFFNKRQRWTVSYERD